MKKKRIITFEGILNKQVKVISNKNILSNLIHNLKMYKGWSFKDALKDIIRSFIKIK